MVNRMDNIPNRFNWIFDGSAYGTMVIENKNLLIRKFFADALRKVMTIFKYTKLPKYIPKRTFEMFILGGYAKIFRKNGEWYCGVGNMYGVQEGNYLPPKAIINNVGINYYKDLKVIYEYNKDEVNNDNIENYCFVIPNDELYYGLWDEISCYAEMQTECVLTLKYILYNNRIPVTSNAPSDEIRDGFNEFYQNIIDGKPFQSISGSSIIDGFKGLENLPFNQHSTNQLKDVIECMQYLKASFENNIGLNANYNMKRESLNDDEIALNDDNLLPTIDQMYESRKKAFDLLNEVVGEKIIEFELDSSWKLKRKEIDLELKQQKVDAQEELTQKDGESDVKTEDQ